MGHWCCRRACSSACACACAAALRLSSARFMKGSANRPVLGGSPSSPPVHVVKPPPSLQAYQTTKFGTVSVAGPGQHVLIFKLMFFCPTQGLLPARLRPVMCSAHHATPWQLPVGPLTEAAIQAALDQKVTPPSEQEQAGV